MVVYGIYRWYKNIQIGLTVFANDKDNHNNKADSFIVNINAEPIYEQDIELVDRYVDPITKNAVNIDKVVNLKRYELEDEYKLLLFVGMYQEGLITMLEEPILQDEEVKIFELHDIKNGTYLDILNVTTNYEFVKMASIFGVEKNNGEDDWKVFDHEKYGELFSGVLLTNYLLPTLRSIISYASELYLDGSLADSVNSIKE